MSTTRHEPHPASAAPVLPHPAQRPHRGPAARLRDLAMGIRFAVSGGREGSTRTALTALGVGLGVGLLLIAASVPQMMDARDSRTAARTAVGPGMGRQVPVSATSVVTAPADTDYRTQTVGGEILRPDGAAPALPPGLDRAPAAGEMYVSPALADLLASPEGRLLKERLNHRTVGLIGETGLLDPGELRFYAGSSTLTTDTGGVRVDGYGTRGGGDPMAPVLIVVVVLACVVLLVPVTVFIATAVRFGGEQRDRRLAALRLVGADARTTRWIAAGEALFGAVLGLAVGAAAFAGGRLIAGSVRVWDLSAFPSDVVPVPWLGALILLAVPVVSVVVTLPAMRAVTVEPLGVVRRSAPRRGRLWWRLLMLPAGLAVLLATGTVGQDPEVVEPWPVAAGTLLVLFSLTALLPWLVDAVVRRLGRGPVAWQLAVRRLQLGSTSATRAVGGITVAVAGATALQMVFAAVHDDFNRVTGQDSERAQLTVSAEFPSGELAGEMITEFRATEGVRGVIGTVEAYVVSPEPVAEGDIRPTTALTVGDCPTLRELARIRSCADGDTFVVHSARDEPASDWIDRTARKGRPVNLNSDTPFDGSAPMLWTLPERSPTVMARPDPVGEEHTGIFATPGAVDVSALPGAWTTAQVQIDESVPDAREFVRNAAARIDAPVLVRTIHKIERDRQYESVRTGLLAAATATMGLIAASMAVAQIEQLRERRRLLAVLVAFGTGRATLAWSVLLQTAVLVVLGTAMAVAAGIGLGTAMLRIIGKPVTHWGPFLPVAGMGAGLILVVTLLSVPVLVRLIRPGGLRTE
ncbi:ABC transporter permease [Streptomyces sp. Tu 2975]|uniref:ABC transporter permease n=1 Tax=Streptomyces sp. Tu 2975 TaxID=2676871 RepID=UPI001FC9DBA5|nr:ABC transporter permease [Streptomyces sp. Tu 2975]